VSNGRRKGKAPSRVWIEIYSAAPWYTTVEDSGEDAILRIWTPGGRDPRARSCIGAGERGDTSSAARRWGE
jgi:hypothetical protein